MVLPDPVVLKSATVRANRSSLITVSTAGKTGLALHFAKRKARSLGQPYIKVESRVLEFLCHADYPGNVRDLQTLIERAVVLARRGSGVSSYRLISRMLAERKLVTLERPRIDHLDVQVNRMHREAILTALKAAKGNRSRAADLLGVARASLWHMMKRLGLPTKTWRRGETLTLDTSDSEIAHRDGE